MSKKLANLKVFCFEPVPLVCMFLEKNIKELKLDDHLTLLNYWKNFIGTLGLEAINQINQNILSDVLLYDNNNNSVRLVNTALSENEGFSLFNFDFNRPSVGGIDALSHSCQIKVNMTTLDQFCQKSDISHINFLKIDTEGHDFHVMKGAENLLSNQVIDFIQFEYIARCKEAGWNLEKAYLFNKFKL